ncbi:MAG TPA: DNA mismatch repair endonuclease MutL [Bacteroidia bacterium]|nr:DNA mismatch repair endonuclease MutL [Bacteroidia bacterium]HRS57793.1 DNA mismatch repair endonuclease MutL [Bacteroidia bacterium]HRU67266.1 DNA mismatch repair endonuclease MutL [Bacteroidia bacterium]
MTDDLIQLLPESVANQIAAGEVVQRPASVVKELLENAIDAGASTIRLVIKESGKSLIQVTDDGCGMSERDARMCFERHATSKIRKADDLFSIKTMGFRGEALPSIASVSSVELRTKRQEDHTGTLVVIEGGELLRHEPCSCVNGTTITVKNLFYNIPVRKNFLKSNQVEYRNIVDEFYRVALPYPEIRFIFTAEKTEVYHLIKSSLKNRIISLFGKKFESLLISVEEKTPLVSIRGFAGKPEAAKKSRGEQFIFVNGRFIRNSFFNHAVQSAYEGLILADSFPFFVLFLEIDPQRVDVNVHPTKTEVKFQDERDIYQILKATVKKSLGQVHLSPRLDFEHEAFLNNLKKIETEKTNEELRLGVKVGKPADFEAHKPVSIPGLSKPNKSDWQKLYEVLQQSEKSEKQSTEKQEQLRFPEEEPENIDAADIPENKFIQLHNKYIFTPIHSGFIVIHQQHAHQRILYEEVLKRLKNANIQSQKQLFPEIVEFNENDFQLFTELRPELEKMGFIFESAGKRAVLVSGIPAGVQAGNVQNYFHSVIEEYKNSLHQEGKELAESLAAAVAIKSGIRTGEILSKEAMSLLVDQLFACENPYYSPKGKPIFIKVDKSELDKKFD